MGTTIPPVFKHELAQNSCFIIQRKQWHELLSVEKGKLHPKWSDVMAKNLKESNPYCAFAFKRHWVKKSFKKKSDLYFKAHAYCMFNKCDVTCNVSIKLNEIMKKSSEIQVDVQYDGVIEHTGKKARHIKGDSRELTAQLLTKYSPSYIRHQGLSLMPAEVFASGNRDGIGATKSVLQKVSSEIKDALRLDDDVIKSLLVLKHQLNKEESNSCDIVPGYIQQINASPFKVVAFNEGGVRIYHDLCDHNVIHCDSTGTIVANCQTPAMCSVEGKNKRLLYYAIVVKSPNRKQSPLAIAEMVSAEHSSLAIANFIARLRRAEKLLFNYKPSMPLVVVIDRSLALLIAFLKEYNNETIMDFTRRSFKEVSGETASTQGEKIIPHACLSHVMKDAKTDFKKNVYVHTL